MERKLIVTLLQKNIQELAMITEGFMEMTEYPAVIIQLARQKTEDMLDYVRMLEEIKKGKDGFSMTDAMSHEEEEHIESIMQADIELVEQAVEKITEETAILIEEVKVVKKLAEEETKIHAEFVEKMAEEAEIEIQRLAKEAAEEEERAKKIAEEEAAKEAQRLVEEEKLAEKARKLAEEEAEKAKKLAEEEAQRKAKEEAEAKKNAELMEKAKKIAEEEAKEVKQERVHEQPKTVLSEQIAIQKNGNDTTIAGAHTQKKIDDINQAISMGNRFRFQRELFEGNGELMNKTLAKLNQMNDFDEASEYLQSKFNWQSDNETVESFYQIVKRKFI
jgi:hypothetical protein